MTSADAISTFQRGEGGIVTDDEIRTTFAEFAGNERLRKWLELMNTTCQEKGRLLYWQERLWEEYAASAPCPVPTDFSSIAEIFLVAEDGWVTKVFGRSAEARMSAGEMVKRLTAIGWFERRGPEAATKLLEHLQEVEADGSPEELLYQEIADLTYLCDGAEDEDAYVQLVQRFAAASRGLFRPDDIAWHEAESGDALRRVTFVVSGHEYSIRYDGDSKYIEVDLAEHINRALADMHIEERFHYLPAVDEGVSVVFVQPELYERALEAGLIPRNAPE